MRYLVYIASQVGWLGMLDLLVLQTERVVLGWPALLALAWFLFYQIQVTWCGWTEALGYFGPGR